MLGREGRLALVLVFSAVVVALLWAHLQVPLVATGDGYSVYFPVVWDLQDGKGASAFDALGYGYFRMPGYSLALFVGTLIAGNVGRAVTVVALGSIVLMLVALLRAPLGERVWVAAFAAALFCGSNCFINMSLVSTPDLACLALQGWALVLALRPRNGWRWAMAGLLGAASILFRLNSLWVVPFLVALCLFKVEREQRWPTLAGLLLGAAVPLSLWSMFSFAHKGELFWIPGAVTELPIHVFHASVLAQSNDLGAALALAPGEMAVKVLLRGLITGPIEVARRAAGLPAALLALGAIPIGWRAPRRDQLLVALALALSWAPIALSGFEPRYFPIQVAALCWAAGLTIEQLRTRFGARWQTPIAGGLLALMLVARVPALRAQLDGQRGGAAFLAATIPLEAAAAGLGEGCIGTEETAYRLSAFRYLMRLEGRDWLCCCGLTEGQSGFLRFKGYGTVGPGELERFHRVTPEGATDLLELYAR